MSFKPESRSIRQIFLSSPENISHNGRSDHVTPQQSPITILPRSPFEIPRTSQSIPPISMQPPFIIQPTPILPPLYTFPKANHVCTMRPGCMCSAHAPRG